MAEFSLDEQQAYDAMVLFVLRYWERAKDDDITRLMALIEPLWRDGAPSDPAMWSDWLECVRDVSADKSPYFKPG